jgi:hypothetical protein
MSQSLSDSDRASSRDGFSRISVQASPFNFSLASALFGAVQLQVNHEYSVVFDAETDMIEGDSNGMLSESFGACVA